MFRACILAACLSGCTGTAPPGGSAVDAPAGGTGDGPGGGNPDAPAGSLEGGTLTVSWMHGSASCQTNTDPEVQVHAYNATVHIIRQNKCKTFEAPFVYVIEGQTKVLVIDSGATNTTALRTAIRTLVPTKPIIVAHSHNHGDHKAGDPAFVGQPNTTVVSTTIAAVQAQFGITTWPTTPGSIDLGGRVLDVIGIPGHEPQHIAFYDRTTGILCTGDTLYPGLLFINDWAAYRTSVARLAQFVTSHPITHVLGAHIEMTATAKQVYPYGTTYQPNEHALPLTAAHVMELDAALTQLGATAPANPVAHDDFVIDPQ